MAITRSFKWLVGIAAVCIIAFLWLAYFFYNLSPISSEWEGNAEPVVVEKGTGFRQVASELLQAGLIRSESDFKLYAILSGNAHKFKPGLYSFTPASSSIEIIRALVAGPAKEITVLITEGQTLHQIDKTLSSFGVVKAGSLISLDPETLSQEYPFLKGAPSLEGFLFPDTYRFYFGSLAKDVASVMLDNFVDKVSPLVSFDGKPEYEEIPVLRRGIFNLYEIVTFASMIESEVPDSEDRKLVADILYRRYRIGMALQIDASVNYATSVKDDRYDTYKNPGLPRGPISNPGLDAIESTLNPKSSAYLYYLSDPATDKTIFSKTFEEHVANKEKYLRR